MNPDRAAPVTSDPAETSDPADAPTVLMSPVPAVSRPRPLAPVVASSFRTRAGHGSLVSRVRRRQLTADEHEPAAEPVVDEAVRVISRTRRHDAAPEARAPASAAGAEPGPRLSETGTGSTGGLARDLGVAAAARKTALIVGSRAREAILGYPLASAESGGGAPYDGEEPAPGQTVVLVGDDVEAWVRERLYGGAPPTR